MREWEYFEWNFGTKVVTQWLRHGECSQCSDCCKAHISYSFGGVGIGLWGPMGKTIGNEQGIWLEARSGNHRLFMSPVTVVMNDPDFPPCRLLVKGGCKAHKHKARKAPLCDLWPIHPSQVEIFPNCSYTFEKIGEEKFE